MTSEIPPFEIPNYTLLSQLGEGAMAVVWLAEHKRNRRKAAIKILKQSMSSPDAEQLFLREGEVLAGFDHPNIVKIYDNDKIGNIAYLAMEVLSGGSLLDRMQRAPIEVGEAIGLATQVASALHAAHRQQVIHRDLKPANVMLRDEITPVLTDFGAVRLLDRSTIYGRDGSIIGTPIYMSPEQITGQPLGGSSDLYALGILFHELLVGHLPFPGTSLQEIATQHLFAPVPQLPPMISMLQPVLEKLLAKLPEHRYNSAQDFIDALRGVFINHEALRKQIGYSGTSTAWSSQLRALGFMLDPRQSEEVRRAQGNYQGANAPTVPNAPVKPKPTSAERSAAIAAAMHAKKARGRVGELPKHDRRAKLQPVVAPASEASEALTTPIPAQLTSPEASPTPTPKSDIAAIVEPSAASVAPVSAAPTLTPEPIPPVAAKPVVAPVATSPAPVVPATPAGNRSVWVAGAAALLIAAVMFWPQSEPPPVKVPDSVPQSLPKPTIQIESMPQGMVFHDFLKDGSKGLDMVVIPDGSFTMGSPESEADRAADEGPQRRVAVAVFAIGKTEVTVAQFRQFVKASGYRTDAEKGVGSKGCTAFKSGTVFGDTSHNTWLSPGFEQADNHPAVCLSWNDAQAYVKWLASETGRPYRLPSEAEQEYVTRAGTATPFSWGGDVNFACSHANVLDRAALQKFAGFPAVDCDDRFVLSSPVGSFPANAFGVHDIVGNVVEWTEDCSNASYEGAPSTSRPWLQGDCSRRVLSGAGWLDTPTHLRSAYRGRGALSFRNLDTGLRPAQDL